MSNTTRLILGAALMWLFFYILGIAYFGGYWKQQCEGSGDTWCRIKASDSSIVWPLTLVSQMGRDRAFKEANGDE